VTTAGPTLPGDSSGKLTVSSGSFNLFDNTLISPADVGRTLVASTTSPDFGGFVGRLTNGRANWVSYLFGPPQGGGGGVFFGSEATLFGLPPGADFAGSTITALTFAVHEFSSMPWAGHPGYTELHINGTLGVRGFAGPTPTPEPSTLMLLGTAIVGLLRARHRRE